MKNIVILSLFLIFTSTLLVSNVGAEVIEEADITVIYETRVNEGSSMLVQLQVNFNTSLVDVVIFSNDTDQITVYTGNQFSVIGEWIDIVLDDQDLNHPGEYQGRVSAERIGGNFSIIETLFFDFVVRPTYGVVGSAIATLIISSIALSPYVISKDKKRVSAFYWNHLSNREYAKHYLKKLEFLRNSIIGIKSKIGTRIDELTRIKSIRGIEPKPQPQRDSQKDSPKLIKRFILILILVPCFIALVILFMSFFDWPYAIELIEKVENQIENIFQEES